MSELDEDDNRNKCDLSVCLNKSTVRSPHQCMKLSNVKLSSCIVSY